MKIKALHPDFFMPKRASARAGAFDIFMPEGGVATRTPKPTKLGFASEVPPGYVALMIPRSGAGSKHGLELFNTMGVIDSDYRGEWIAVLRTKKEDPFIWKAGDRILQFLLVPIATASSAELEQVQELADTTRGIGGFGSTGT